MARTQDVLDHPVTRAVTGAAVVGGVVIAVAVSLSALIAPLPVADIQEPVVVDEAPGLPSDQEPLDGWPAPTMGDDFAEESAAATGDDGTTPTTDSDSGDDVDPGDSLVDDTLDDVTDTVGDVIDDVTDTVDDVTDTVDDITEDATDTVDDVTEDATATLP